CAFAISFSHSLSLHDALPICMGCQPCSITTGFAGAGAFSDGKLSLSPDVGGNLPEILGYEKTKELLKESDSIYLKFGADTRVYGDRKSTRLNSSHVSISYAVF